MELSCSPTQSGSSVGLSQCSRSRTGGGWSTADPVLGPGRRMVGTTWYQQRQMQQMSGQTNPQMR